MSKHGRWTSTRWGGQGTARERAIRKKYGNRCRWHIKNRGRFCDRKSQNGKKYCSEHAKAMQRWIAKQSPDIRYNNVSRFGAGH